MAQKSYEDMETARAVAAVGLQQKRVLQSTGSTPSDSVDGISPRRPPRKRRPCAARQLFTEGIAS